MSINEQFIKELQALNIEAHDVRAQFPRKGNYPWKGNTWAYAAVHYTAAWRERGSYEQELNSWLGHARFHVNTRGWPGIAYNIGITPSGRVFLMKDIERWGYHAFNVNEIAMAVSTDTTYGQDPTPQMMRALQAVLDVLDGILPQLQRKNIYTHNQFRWYDRRNADTLCAGEKIDSAIAAYNGGKDFAKDVEAVPDMKPDHAHISLTDKWVVGNMYKMWTSIGGNVLVFGYPISGMVGNDTDGYIQYFERAVFHYTPNGKPFPEQHNVHLRRVGREVADARYGRDHPAFRPIPEFESDELHRYYAATGHSISNGFLGYWMKYGGVRLFGFPISEEFVEDDRVVQYFERARFEWEPGSDAKRYDVVLGRLGAELYEEKIPELPNYSGDTPIHGTGTLTPDAIDQALQHYGERMASRYAPDGQYRKPPTVGQALVDVCQAHNVNWDMVTAQIIHESAGWQSRIVRDKNNPSGLGASNDNPYGNAYHFDTPADGVRATVAHLLSYADGDDSPLREHSARHEVLRNVGYLGVAKMWKDLNGRWAWPGETYAQSIATLANQIVREHDN